MVAPGKPGSVVACYSVLNIQDSNIPVPQVKRVADVEELFLPPELQFMQRLGPRLPAEAVELLAMDANDVSEIAVPAKNGADDFVEFWEIQVIRD